MTSNERVGGVELPPRPDPLTGEPHPPPAPREWPGHASEAERDPRRFGSWPKEQGPLLECYRPTKRGGISAAVGLVVIAVVGLTITTGDTSWMSIWWMWSFPALCIPLGLSITTHSRCAAGAEWFQHKNSWVRQYELASVKIRMRYWNRYLHLKDRDGRKVAVFTGEVQQNQRLWDLLYNGILHSVVAGGAETNRIARRALKLPAPSAPGEHR
jgi:hypothetical protein